MTTPVWNRFRRENLLRRRPAPPFRRHPSKCARRLVVNFTFLASVLWIAGCQGSSPNRPELPGTGKGAESPPFRDAAEEAGLLFQHENGATGEFYFPEMTGGGVALLDYDNDGDLDVFMIQGGPFGPDQATAVADQAPRHRLYRNDLTRSSGARPKLQFTDVSAEMGLSYSDYGNGAATADYDRDGDMDVYITTYGKQRLLRNDGPRGFTDVTNEAGVGTEGWATSASWLDYDLDGRLDLFVCHYEIWSFDLHKSCTTNSGARDYCGPKSFEPARSRLYHNLGGDRFEDVSDGSGIQSLAGAALGVVAADLTRDGWPDLLVANDGMANFLWINQRDGTFREEAVFRGCALNGNGEAEANMGVIVADLSGDGLDDLFITHLTQEKNTLFLNVGSGQFVDASARAGLDAPSRPYTGFGTGALDFDNDGLLDIFCTNGAVRQIDEQVARRVPRPLRQRCQLFRRSDAKRLRFIELREGAALQLEENGRAAAFGDIDNDGDVDVIVGNNGGPARLLLNEVGQDRHWLGLRVVVGSPPTLVDDLGAVVTLREPRLPPATRRCATDGSYCSAGDPRILFGLDTVADRVSIAVRWTDGTVENWSGLDCDRYHVIIRGTGTGASAPADSRGSSLTNQRPESGNPAKGSAE